MFARAVSSCRRELLADGAAARELGQALVELPERREARAERRARPSLVLEVVRRASASSIAARACRIAVSCWRLEHRDLGDTREHTGPHRSRRVVQGASRAPRRRPLVLPARSLPDQR